MTASTRTLLAIGGYTENDAPTGGTDPTRYGLTTWWWDGATGITVAGGADLPSPSFACWHPTHPMLYAVSELPDGVVTALRVAADGTLEVVTRTATGGAHPCWVTVDPAGTALLIANYGSGSMAVLALDEGGLPVGEPVVVAHEGSGPVPDRQEGPHVHQVVPTADGNVFASDLGTDRIVEYRIDTDPATASRTTVTPIGAIAMPAGSGTRHMALAAGGRTGFVTGELDGTVTVIRRRPDGAGAPDGAGGPDGAAAGVPYEAAGSAWVAAEQVPCSADASAQPSQLLLAGGDRWLLVANRGPDTIAVLEVAAGLRIRQEVSVAAGPRYFTLDGDRLLLACQQGGVVQTLSLDEATGQLSVPTDMAVSPGAASPFRAPSCVAVRPGTAR